MWCRARIINNGRGEGVDIGNCNHFSCYQWLIRDRRNKRWIIQILEVEGISNAIREEDEEGDGKGFKYGKKIVGELIEKKKQVDIHEGDGEWK